MTTPHEPYPSQPPSYQPPPGHQLVPIPPEQQAPTHIGGIPQHPQQYPTNAPVAPPRPKRSKLPLLVGGVLGGIAAVALLVAALTGGGSSTSTTAASQPGYTELPESTRSPRPVLPASPAPVASAPAAAPVPAATKAAPAGTVSQRNAVDKAESYLSFTAFSRTGLIKQLEYEGFTNAEATYAVDNVTVDWTDQAAKKAESYMEFTSFSRSGLIKQLTYEGFTQAQAEHGASSVGL